MFTSIYRLICRKNGLKTAKIPMLGGEMAIEKTKEKKSRGRLIVLNSEAAKIVLKKARYKRGDSTR